jgi:hypothetical protein
MILWGFPVLANISGREKEPEMGLFSFIPFNPLFYTFQRKRNTSADPKIRQRNEELLPCSSLLPD